MLKKRRGYRNKMADGKEAICGWPLAWLPWGFPVAHTGTGLKVSYHVSWAKCVPRNPSSNSQCFPTQSSDHLGGMVNMRLNAFTLRMLQNGQNAYWQRHWNLPSSKESELFGFNNKLSPIITGEPTVKEKICEMIVSHRNALADSVSIIPNIRTARALNFISLVHCRF